MLTYQFIAAIIMVSGFIQAFTGFGFALVAAPLLFFLIEPKSAIVMIVCLGTVLVLAMTFFYRKHLDLKRVLFLSLGSIIGVIPGAYLLSIMRPTAIKLVVASVIIILSIFLIANRFPYLRPFVFWHIIIGFCSGLLMAATSMGGPPTVVFLLSQKINKKEFLGTVSASAIILIFFTLFTYGSMGMITEHILKTTAISLPALGVGVLLGTVFVRKIDNRIFRYIAVAVVLVSAIMTIVTTVAG